MHFDLKYDVWLLQIENKTIQKLYKLRKKKEKKILKGSKSCTVKLNKILWLSCIANITSMRQPLYLIVFLSYKCFNLLLND